MSGGNSGKRQLGGLALGAIGVVYGDIGTSPLYTLKECFSGSHAVPLEAANILGILSLVFWSIMVVVSLKYVLLIMRADNRGEGGTLALVSLALRAFPEGSRRRWAVAAVGFFGAAMFYGDGMITPAISVLSAVEGLVVVAPSLAHFVVPATLVILVLLFFVQRHGTAQVGKFFGPVMCLWFATLGVMGVAEIAAYPEVLGALNPVWAWRFMAGHKLLAFITLGAVVLALTGAEALYADMGHFGKLPIRLAWFVFVLPCLLLNYFGQGALLLHTPQAVSNPFYLLAPEWGRLGLVVLSTCATVIASQAVISGAFSLTRQAIQLGYCPRLAIQHTSDREIGQIYIPFINWSLLVTILLLVLGFQSSSNLAAAYGIAVTTTMAIDTTLFFVVALALWKWNRALAISLYLLILLIDLSFFSANAIKIPQGGWFPLFVGAIVFTLLTTWARGRQILFERLKSESLPLDLFLESIKAVPPTRVEGTAVFLTSTTHTVPHALLHNLKHNKVLHERVVFLTILTQDIPYVQPEDRIHIEDLGGNFFRLEAHYGFMEEPLVPQLLEQCAARELSFDMMDTSFFLSRETLIATAAPGMAIWREKLFVAMSANAVKAMDFFHIPTNRVVELGTQIEL